MKFLSIAVLAAALSPSALAVDALASSSPALASSSPALSRSLDGDWSFRYIAGGVAGTDAAFMEPRFDASAWPTIPVPANWELKGFAEPQYGDDLKEGIGLYRRTFRVPAGWQGQRVFLRFEGVAFGYEVWVNGRRAGASSASAFNRHTFDVTALLAKGSADNVLAVKVLTRPHGVEFDLNDDWSLSGIYRPVQLFAVPATHLTDLATRTTLTADGSAVFAVDATVSRADGEVRATLVAPDGRTVGEVDLPRRGDLQHAGILRVTKPALWTAETPSLYRLQLTVTARGKVLQTVEQRVGLREISIAGAVLRLNGRPIKLRGVNHHDLDPLAGRAITREQMKRDLLLMKAANVNYVRTSHYPPARELLDLCDELGLYVMDEVAIGYGDKNLDRPDYRANILGRVEPTIRRDRNHASVLVWSIGNENPITEVELEAGRIAKRLDPTRPITYPKVGSYFAANYRRIPDWVDIHAPHYPVNERIAEYARTLKHPAIFTEYAHALGLATDRLQDQWELIWRHPVFAGGSIWHFMDQGILRTAAAPVDPDRPTQLVWLDRFRHYDTHGLDGADGVVYADRTPQTDYWQMRKVYAPVQIAAVSTEVKPGRQDVALTVENRHDFRSLAGMRLAWALQRNGRAIGQGELPLQAAARQTQTLQLPVDVPADAGDDVLALALRVLDGQGTQITERTVQLGPGRAPDFAALLAGAAGAAPVLAGSAGAAPILAGSASAAPVLAASAGAAPVVTEAAGAIRVALPQWTLTVARASGAVTIRDRAGRDLVAGIVPHSGRRPTMAEELGSKKTGLWLPSTLDRIDAPVVQVTQEAGGVRIAVSGRWPRSDLPAEGYRGGYQLAIDARGAIAVRYEFTVEAKAGTLSEAGLSLVAPAGLDEFRWIGQGPYAGYPGKDRLNEFGLFHLHRTDLRFQGNRRGTSLALLTTAAGAGFALASAPADVAVERSGAGALLSHNALIAGLGNKGTAPETTLPLGAHPTRVAGSFTLLPLDDAWPAPLTRWFGAAGATDIFRPFLHSYDQ
ncbi:beta-galactosidase [Pseudoduganella lurida]|uniref:Beta-galactosidase n=1 Tax=Pseudoduganella lurida TaxID=1036180 RepID=A0A562RKR2_9BURK|nr:glycoside hydrolase family 2 TIM barrel-domain containing protein [Pseudoduganella lurida]TWI69513.1 beta-galactosidase [Pseudoduganella lurida]